MSNPLVDFYRCPAELITPASPEEYYLGAEYSYRGETLSHGLPSDSSIIDNLRLERYSKQSPTRTGALLASEAARWLYYQIRPALSDSLRQTLQRISLRDWDQLPFPRWPVDTSVEDILERDLLAAMKSARLESIPFIWFWPDGVPSAAVMTHDVEATAGLALVPELMDIDDEFGIKASFQLVPEQRYAVSNDLLELIRKRQCEVNVHGLNHDGNLFRDREILPGAVQAHQSVRGGVRGQRIQVGSGMYRNVDWFGEPQDFL